MQSFLEYGTLAVAQPQREGAEPGTWKVLNGPGLPHGKNVRFAKCTFVENISSTRFELICWRCPGHHPNWRARWEADVGGAAKQALRGDAW
eukprot:SAG11_NODE_1177_length_5600_cov_2.043447_5_plen_91_part_00